MTYSINWPITVHSAVPFQKLYLPLTEARQGRGRELEVEVRQSKFEARPRRGPRGDPSKNPPSPRCIAEPNLVALSQTV